MEKSEVGRRGIVVAFGLVSCLSIVLVLITDSCLKNQTSKLKGSFHNKYFTKMKSDEQKKAVTRTQNCNCYPDTELLSDGDEILPYDVLYFLNIIHTNNEIAAQSFWHAIATISSATHRSLKSRCFPKSYENTTSST